MKLSSHESATFRGGGGHFCGRVARLATSQGLKQLSPDVFDDFMGALVLWVSWHARMSKGVSASSSR